MVCQRDREVSLMMKIMGSVSILGQESFAKAVEFGASSIDLWKSYATQIRIPILSILM